MEIRTIIGDAAYSGKDNLEKCDQDTIQLIAKLNPNVSKGNRQKADNFFFNKDSGMFVCPKGHQAIRKAKTGEKSQKRNQSMIYYFDVEKYKNCPLEGICHKVGTQTKTYNVTLKSTVHQKQIDFEQTDNFREKVKLRYRIEAKNSQLKNRYGLRKASSSGLFGMTIQSASTVFIANMKRILRIIGS